MKYILVIIAFPLIASGQIVTTIAGGGTAGLGDGGLATVAQLSVPASIAFDLSGNMYIADANNKRIREVSTTGIISTIAGTGADGTTGDGGYATLATFDNPSGVAVDESGNIYVTDQFVSRVRVISPSGIINPFAGTGVDGFDGDGIVATSSKIGQPLGITADKTGNVLFTSEQRIRKVSSGIITTVAGNGYIGFSGDNGPATDATIHNPHGVAVDKNGNIYIADMDNYRVRKVSSTGIITTIAGDGTSIFTGPNGDGGPATNARIHPWDVIVDNFNNIFISDYDENTIRVILPSGYITTIAGNNTQGFTGDNGPATAAEFYLPYDLAFDACDNIYVADGGNNRIRKITYPHCNYLDVPTASTNNNEIVIYPNPSYGQLNINNLKTSATYRLLNILGTINQQGWLKEGDNRISLQSLPDGIYIMELTDDEGNKTVKKIIKQ